MAGHREQSERKRGRRLLVLTGSWLPWLAPWLALATLLLLRTVIVRVIEGAGAVAPQLAAASAGAGGAAAAAGAGAGAAALPPRLQNRTHCNDRCFKAFDGVCDEGRPAAPIDPAVTSGRHRHLRRLHRWGWPWRGWQGPALSPAEAVGAGQRRQQRQQQRGRRRTLGVEGYEEISPILCDLGTDCSDCGAWEGTVPDLWDEYEGPVSWARAAHNVSMFSRVTDTPRPFLAAIAHHTVDPDVSAMLWHYSAMEGGITRIVHHVLNGQCEPAAAGGRRRLVVDVGANFGYYTVQAALYGCSVVAFEPVRKFRALLEWSLHANGVAARVAVRPEALSDAEGAVRLGVPRDGTYWGLASVESANLQPKEILQEIMVPATTLDRWEAWAPPGAKPQDLLLLKLDLEGWEAPVLRGGAKLLARYADNVLLEYSPGIFERRNMSHLPPQADLPASLLALSAAGFRLAHLPVFSFAAPWPPLRVDPAAPLPAFEEVAAAALRHDLEAIEYRRTMEVDPGGCRLPPELVKRFPVWRGCREWTYGAHPKGFRSAFGFNTNVWAARRTAAAAALMRLQGTAALFEEGQDMRVWTSLSRPGTAVGLINCSLVGHGHVQLFRCTCQPGAPAACFEQHSLVQRLAAEGRMPFTGGGGGGAGAAGGGRR